MQPRFIYVCSENGRHYKQGYGIEVLLFLRLKPKINAYYVPQ